MAVSNQLLVKHRADHPYVPRFEVALAPWRRGPNTAGLGIGIGVAHGLATVGPIGFRDRLDYAAIGSVSNLAARLFDAAEDGQILVDGATARLLLAEAPLQSLGRMPLRGFADAPSVFAIAALPGASAEQAERPTV